MITRLSILSKINKCGIEKTQFKITINNHNKRFQSDFLGVNDIIKFSPYEELEVQVDRYTSPTNPILVNAYGKQRDVACICGGEMHFLTLVKGAPVRSKCGHWFQLIDEPEFWKYLRIKSIV